MKTAPVKILKSFSNRKGGKDFQKKERYEAFSNRRGNKGGLQNKEALLDEFFLESFPALLRLLRTVRYTFFWLSIFINLKDMKRKISIL